MLILLRNVFKTAGRVKYGCRAMSMFSGLIRNVQRMTVEVGSPATSAMTISR